MCMLPGHLLVDGRASQRPQTLRKPGVRRGELVRSHGLRPTITGAADGPHDLRPLAIQVLAETHARVSIRLMPSPRLTAIAASCRSPEQGPRASSGGHVRGPVDALEAHGSPPPRGVAGVSAT